MITMKKESVGVFLLFLLILFSLSVYAQPLGGAGGEFVTDNTPDTQSVVDQSQITPKVCDSITTEPECVFNKDRCEWVQGPTVGMICRDKTTQTTALSLSA